MKRHLVAPLFAVLALVLASCAGGDGTANETSPPQASPAEDDGNDDSAAGLPAEIRVGMLLSTSGGSAQSGLEEQQGIEMAVEEIHESGILGDSRIVLVDMDDGSEPQQAVTTAQRLVQEDIVACVCGTVSNAVVAALPTFQDAQIPYLIVNSFTPGITEDNGDYIYQVSQPTSKFNQQMASQVSEELGVERAAILYAQDVPTTVAFRDDFIAGFEEVGVEIVVDEGMDLEEQDHSVQLRQAIERDADVLVTNFTGPVNAAIIVQAHELEYMPHTFGHIGDVQPAFTEIGGEAVVGHYATTGFVPETPVDRVQEFVQSYEDQHGELAPATAAQGYDAMWILATAIAEHGSAEDGQDVKAALDALGEVEIVQGSTGTGSFDDTRVLRFEGVIVQMNEELRWEPWTP